MKELMYKSTRGSENFVTASKAIINGISEDGGLYVPESIPKINFDAEKLKGLDYKSLAFLIMKEFFTDFTEDELKHCINSAYDDKFETPEITPVTKISDEYFLELYHGPTLAFKDVALSILPHLLKTSVKKQGIDKKVLILTATSGDTGKAALSGFNNVDGIKIMVFYPENGVSRIQRLQMLTHDGKNTSVVGIKGNFDDAQTAVKNIFTDEAVKNTISKNGYIFSSANSINIGRLIPQVVYYFYSYLSLYKNGEIGKDEKINFVVPTGNFGDILAGFLAKKMGLPINKLICASNKNKVLYDFINTGIYNRNRDFFVTNSPSMDILVSSNLERLLYFISGESSTVVSELMQSLKTKGEYEITSKMKENLYDFCAGFASETETSNAIKDLYEKHGKIIDTHTAVAYYVYNKYKADSKDTTKTVILATASPYKFPKAVMEAIDDKFNGLDEFILIDEMNKLSNYKTPMPIKGIDKKPIVHNTVCEKNEINNVILKYAK
ncbi:MAG: threonine synthase [Clostridium sp.]|nr:threonine synthase [Clostridium sp.]